MDINSLIAKELHSMLVTRAKKKEGIIVQFQSRYDETVGWEDDEDNVSPYVALARPDKFLQGQREPDAIVIPLAKIRIKFDYPLAQPVIYEYEADTPDGFTRCHLAECVVKGYNQIYKEENDYVANHKQEQSEYTGPCLNRPETHGPHGIWGHGLGDLMLHTVSQSSESDDLFELGVDS